ncbi:MAG: thioredoxin domain-containing protein [Chloroflexi bacterium]|nr:thioredoxin domain-containing protein [Chloroflexota bacterium]
MPAAHPHTNRLAGETSPYLLQHAHNPVDWYPWGPEALERARREDKPIFLSIGYAACHWCHVMERESFEDEATAAELNAGFVPVKVDREERPDIDQVYMGAVQAMTGSGGWPLSVFLTPGGRPFYGGTYFPNESRHGLPSFRDVLAGVERAWRERRDEVERAGAQLVEGMAGGRRLPVAASLPSSTVLDEAVHNLESQFDAANGGWGSAPKFPQPIAIEFLLRRYVATGDTRALAMARRSLDRMADGGIHDHLGGGFARYATDATWLVPHFEKMLYDNAQLASAYLHAAAVADEPRYRHVATATLDYVLREMTTPDGLWAASQDADTEGQEGLTYVWTPAEIKAVLAPDDAQLVCDAFGVTDRGNFEGRTILSRVRDDEELARIHGLEIEVVPERLAQARVLLLAARARRPQPARDDKAIAAWNGLLLSALADAAVALATAGDAQRAARYIAAAKLAADRLLVLLRGPDGRFSRSWKDGRASGQGVLEDQAHVAEGLLALYAATWDERWYAAALETADAMLRHFRDPAGGFFDTADDHEPLPARPKELQDNALPSGNAMAVTVLLKLAALTGDGRYRDAAERGLGLVSAFAARYPTGFGQWLSALDFALAEVLEVAIVGDQADPATGALLAQVRAGYRPHEVVALAPGGTPSAIPLLHDRPLLDGLPTAYVCRGFACRRPTTDPAELSRQLSEGFETG